MQGNPPVFDKSQLFRDAYRATPEQFQIFVKGMEAVLNQWVALLLVAQHCDTRALPTLFQYLVDFFDKKGEVYPDELEDLFEDFFNSARNVIIEDDSSKEIGEVLHNMYCRCCRNDFSTVEHFMGTLQVFRQQNPLALCVNGAPDNDNDIDLQNEGDEEGEEETGEAVEMSDEVQSGDPQMINQPNTAPQQSAPNKKKKKNNHVKTSDGWNLVL